MHHESRASPGPHIYIEVDCTSSIHGMVPGRYDFQMVYDDLNTIGLDLAATIHTKRGLLTRVSRTDGYTE